MAKNEQPEQDAEPAPKKGPGLMTLIKAAVFITVIVVIQVVAASAILPTAKETAEIAKDLASANLDEEQTDSDSDAETTDEDNSLLADSKMTEVSLGSFHVLSYNPNSGSRTNVDFELFATVLEDETGDFENLYETNKQRVREQVLVTLRGTEMTDLTDPTLDLIKRKILEKINRTLGKPLLQEAIFSKFSFEER